jgi:hypothetical protein
MLANAIKKRKINYSQTEDFRFFIENASKYAIVLGHYHITPAERSPFKVIQGNIIIRAMINKEIIDDVVSKESQDAIKADNTPEYLKKKMWSALEEQGAPYFNMDKARIYIPVYSMPLNIIYNDHCDKLLEYPYDQLATKPLTSCIDLFDAYGYKVYESAFTTLVLIKEDKTSAAFYSNDFSIIYIINNQGRLDQEIPIYDKYLKHPEMHHALNKINAAVEAYYSNDYQAFVFSLYNNGLISKKVFKRLKKRISRSVIRREKFADQGAKNDKSKIL